MELEKMTSPVTRLEAALLIVQVVAIVMGFVMVIGWCRDILNYLATST